MASGATCVQRLDGSRDSAIHTKYRISLRSSSMREPRYPLPRVVFRLNETRHICCSRHQIWGHSRSSFLYVSLTHSAPGLVSGRGRMAKPHALGMGGSRRIAPLAPKCCKPVRGSFCWAGFDNDPSAGSPTETLLRFLLPLNDKVQWTSRDVTGSEPPMSPRSEHFTGPFNR